MMPGRLVLVGYFMAGLIAMRVGLGSWGAYLSRLSFETAVA